MSWEVDAWGVNCCREEGQGSKELGSTEADYVCSSCCHM